MLVLWQSVYFAHRQTDRQTDRQADRQTDRQTERGRGVICVGGWKRVKVRGFVNGYDGLWLDNDHDVVQIGGNKQHVFFRL